MPLYRWQDSAISQMECSPGEEDHPIHAVLRLQEPALFNAVQNTLAQNHIASYIRPDDAGDALVIPQAKDEKQLMDIAASNGWIKGTPQKIITQEDKKAEAESHSKSFLKKDPMVLTGAALLVTSLTWFGSALMRAKHNPTHKFRKEDWSELMVGVINLAGNIPFLMYAKTPAKDEMQVFHEELAKHLQKDGVVLEKTADVSEDSIRKSGFLQSTEGFFKKNTVSWLSFTKASAAALVAHSATKKETFNPGKLVGGSIYSAAWWATFLLDKPHAPPYKFKTHDGDSQSVVQWLAENPRKRITSPVGMVTGGIKLYGALDEGWKANQAIKNAKNPADLEFNKARRYDFLWNVVAYTSVVIANYTFGKTGTKKTAQQSDPQGFERDLLASSANLLATMPENVRQAAVSSAAEYVTSIQGINHSQSEVERLLNQQIEHLNKLGVTPSPQEAVSR